MLESNNERARVRAERSESEALVEMKTHHVCYEGTLACSGCNPCQHCSAVVNREVLAQAMRRTTDVISQARGPQGVVSVAELDAQNFWAVFWGYYVEGWRNLHGTMMNDPKVAERAYDLRSIPGFVETGRYVPPVLAAPTMMTPMATSPMAAPPPAAVSPLSAVVPSASPPGAMPSAVAPLSVLAIPGAPGEAAAPWSVPFMMTDAGAAPVAAGAMSVDTPADVVEADAKSTVGPTDIRRAITVDDIAASATVLEAAPPASPSTNGVPAHD